MVDIKDVIKVGSKAVVVADCDIRGNITIGPGCILHPRCTILAMSGPIILGSNCIIEESVVLVNRTKQTVVIGDDNLFQVGCRVEAVSIGSNNTFGARCRVAHTMSIASYCNIGAGCSVLPCPFPPAALVHPSPRAPDVPEDEQADDEDGPVAPIVLGEVVETLPDFTVVFGAENRRRKWTGEGKGQIQALHAKHLNYLAETLPKYHKLKLFT
ncbi:hypothetical protein RQP46_001156 [Phenoliferia psychrophenolica]